MYDYIQNVRMKIPCSEMSSFLVKKFFWKQKNPYRQTTKPPKIAIPIFLLLKVYPITSLCMADSSRNNLYIVNSRPSTKLSGTGTADKMAVN